MLYDDRDNGEVLVVDAAKERTDSVRRLRMSE